MKQFGIMRVSNELMATLLKDNVFAGEEVKIIEMKYDWASEVLDIKFGSDKCEWIPEGTPALYYTIERWQYRLEREKEKENGE